MVGCGTDECRHTRSTRNPHEIIKYDVNSQPFHEFDPHQLAHPRATPRQAIPPHLPIPSLFKPSQTKHQPTPNPPQHTCTEVYDSSCACVRPGVSANTRVSLLREPGALTRAKVLINRITPTREPTTRQRVGFPASLASAMVHRITRRNQHPHSRPTKRAQSCQRSISVGTAHCIAHCQFAKSAVRDDVAPWHNRALRAPAPAPERSDALGRQQPSARAGGQPSVAHDGDGGVRHRRPRPARRPPARARPRQDVPRVELVQVPDSRGKLSSACISPPSSSASVC